MSKSEIMAEVVKLSHEDRRELARVIFEMEEDVQVLRESDRNANERFLMLDAMEAEDAKTRSK